MGLSAIARSIMPEPAFRLARRTIRSPKAFISRIGTVDMLPRTRLCDRLWHRTDFKRVHGRDPVSGATMINDYLYWMKTSREIEGSLRVTVSDKEHVKDFIAQHVGSQFNVPTIAVLRSYTEAARFEYPSRCVIKPTHASGQVIFRRDAEEINLGVIDSWFDLNFYHRVRERNYRKLKPKVIVEPLIFGQFAPEDFKVFCWRGVPRFIQVDISRFGKHVRAYFDPEWKQLPFTMNHPAAEGSVARPPALDVMIELATKLSTPFTFIRVDFYANGSEVVVGELTNCPEAGRCVFKPASAELAASRLLFGRDFT